jgi:hypothetical protein
MRNFFKRASFAKKILLVLLFIIVSGFFIPQNLQMPVKNANRDNYNQKSFWYYPWGKSGTHKGVDIFAAKRTSVFSSTGGVVLFTGNINRGGNMVLVLGPKWRLHYYAHLDTIKTSAFSFVDHSKIIGNRWNLRQCTGKNPSSSLFHLHSVPYLWRIDFAHQGWKKMFYLNPILYLNESFTERQAVKSFYNRLQ